MEEIRQKDLKPYPHLVNLRLEGNRIQIITADLFKFNRELKVVSLKNNHLMKISPSALEGLVNANDLWLSGNLCSLYDAKNRATIPFLIKKVRETCSVDDENPIKCGDALVEVVRLRREVDEKNFEIQKLKVDLEFEGRKYRDFVALIVD